MRFKINLCDVPMMMANLLLRKPITMLQAHLKKDGAKIMWNKYIIPSTSLLF